MGLIAKILDSFKRDGIPGAKVEIYKGDNANTRIFNPPGVDARPLDGDYGYAECTGDTEGGRDLLGFIDPNNEPQTEKGESRLYSRESNGTIIGFIHLKKTGEIEIDSGKGVLSIKLLPTGNFEVTTLSGVGDLIFDNVSFKNHIHIDSWGLPTGVPLEIGVSPPSPPTAVVLQSNIDTATNSKKIDNKQFLAHGHSGIEPGSGTSGGVA